MPILLYYVPYSAPCRSVLLTANALKLDLDLKLVDLPHLEHMSPEFMKINPQHKVPVLVDEDGFTLTESRAIITYLVDKYAPNSTLYPQDLKSRALINHRLFFEMGTLYQRCLNYYTPIWKTSAEPNPYHCSKLEEALKYLDMFLKDNKYMAGENITVADFSVIATVSIMMDMKTDLQYDSIQRWYERIKVSVPGFKEAITDNKTDLMKIARF